MITHTKASAALLAALAATTPIIAQPTTSASNASRVPTKPITPPAQRSATGSAFTYQGQLKTEGLPANGPFDLRFTLFDDLGNTIAGPLCLDNVPVINGLFVVTLDFGEQFTGSARELGIEVKAGGPLGNCDTGAFTPLADRQPITPAPYAEGLALPFLAKGDNARFIFAVEHTGFSGGQAAIRGSHGDPLNWPFSDAAGVLGTSSGTFFSAGVVGYSRSGVGLIGYDDGDNGTGVLARADGLDGIALRAIGAGENFLAASLEGDVDITGTLNYPDGAAEGLVLTSDAQGNASWARPNIDGFTTTGNGPDVTADLGFLTSTQTVTIEADEQIFVTATRAFGSTAVGGADGLDLYIGWRVAGTGSVPTRNGLGILDCRVPQNTRVPMTVSAVIGGLAAGTYEVGMVGDDDGNGNWNSNEFGYVSVVILP